MVASCFGVLDVLSVQVPQSTTPPAQAAAKSAPAGWGKRKWKERPGGSMTPVIV